MKPNFSPFSSGALAVCAAVGFVLNGHAAVTNPPPWTAAENADWRPVEGSLTYVAAGSALDRFDYLVACLKENGVYLYFDAMTSWRGYRAGPGWSKEANAARFKSRIFFDDSVREHWKAGVRTLLQHVNPYTKTRLADDPVVAGFAYLRHDVTPSPHYVEIPLQRAHVFDAVQHARALSGDQAKLSLLTGVGLAYPGQPLLLASFPSPFTLAGGRPSPRSSKLPWNESGASGESVDYWFSLETDDS
jgi:hypothetical protein